MILKNSRGNLEREDTEKVNHVELEKIDTSGAAKYIATKLDNKKNYFLHGKWGAGKTEFLNEIKNHSSKKFIELDLWNIKNNRRVIGLTFEKLHPFIYYGSIILSVVAICVSIIYTPAINLGMEQLIPINIREVTKIFVVISLLVTIWRYCGIKSEDAFYWILGKFNKGLSNKVLVVDDFDRVSEERQGEAYKVFNILSGKIPIIFLGDYSKLKGHNNGFLPKIIDQKLLLPLEIHPKKFWGEYFKKLSSILGEEISEMVVNLFIDQDRNLRDRKQFNDIVNQEFFEYNKKDYVKITQQILVIYMYLFDPKLYDQIFRRAPLLSHSEKFSELEIKNAEIARDYAADIYYELQSEFYFGYNAGSCGFVYSII